MTKQGVEKANIAFLAVFAAAVVLVSVGGPIHGDATDAERRLDVWDSAPPLNVAEWIKGPPVQLEEGKGKTVFVVEFWATWCPPCRTSMPHLTEVQEKYKDRGVVIVGVSTEKKETVREFVEGKKKEKIGYRIAVDNNRATWNAYMKAAGAPGIPHAFVIDKDGRIAWRGHPLDDAFSDVIERLAFPPKEPADSQL